MLEVGQWHGDAAPKKGGLPLFLFSPSFGAEVEMNTMLVSGTALADAACFLVHFKFSVIRPSPLLVGTLSRISACFFHFPPYLC